MVHIFQLICTRFFLLFFQTHQISLDASQTPPAYIRKTHQKRSRKTWCMYRSVLTIVTKQTFHWQLWVESGEKFQKDTFQFSEKTHLGVSVTARMIRVTPSLPQTVGINALVTQQLSVEGKRITLSYTLSMAQGGNSKKHIFLQRCAAKHYNLLCQTEDPKGRVLVCLELLALVWFIFDKDQGLWQPRPHVRGEMRGGGRGKRFKLYFDKTFLIFAFFRLHHSKKRS